MSKEDRLAENVPGKYYVTNACINCGICRDIAAKNFAENANIGLTVVSLQPTTPEEIALCEQALSSCPVSAIGNDG